MNYILEAQNLKKYYGKEPNITKALDGVSLAVGQGEFVSIIGTSGSGKSTLLNMLGVWMCRTLVKLLFGEKRLPR